MIQRERNSLIYDPYSRKQYHGDLSQTVEWLIANGADELAPPVLSTSKRKAKKSNITSDSIDYMADTGAENTSPQKKDGGEPSSVNPDLAEGQNIVPGEIVSPERNPANMPLQPADFKSPKVQVVIPKLRGAPDRTELKELQTKASTSLQLDVIDAPSRKPKRRKTTLDQSEPTAEHESTSDPIPSKDRKRGRGRPRKETTASLIVKETIPEGDEREKRIELAPQEIHPQDSSPLPRGKDNHTEAMVPHVTDPPTPTPLSKIGGATSPTPEKRSKPTTDSQPPSNNKVKVQYRVGLSKRARIAPLLRVVKK